MRVHNMLEVRLLHEAARNHGKMLESLALTDPLTGLANRRLLAERMSMALVHARREQSGMAVVYLDLDGFKEINNTLGHAAGDALLKMVAERLRGDGARRGYGGAPGRGRIHDRAVAPRAVLTMRPRWRRK